MTKAAPQSAMADRDLLELFFSQSLTGAFFMMLDEPIAWHAPDADKDALLEYAFTHQRVTRVNDAMLAQYGASAASFIGRTPADFYAHDPVAGRRAWREFFNVGQYRSETDERRIDGTPIRIDGEYMVLFTADGRIAGHFGVQRDVTERYAAEQALRDSEARYAAAFRLSPFRLTINRLDDGRFLEVNEAFLQDLNRTREEVIGRTSVELGLWADPGMREQYIQRLRAEGTIVDFEFAGYEKGARREITQLSSTIIELQGTACVLTIAHDVTDRRLAEESAEASRQQLRALATRLQQVREDERRALSREIHDELGQVLTGVTLDLAWALSHLPASAAAERARLTDALDRVGGAMTVVRRIAAALRPAMLDDLGLVAALEWQAQQFARLSAVRTTVQLPASDPPLSHDARTTVFRIVQEALTNIARHSGAHAVHVEMTADPAHVEVVVRDDGRGITAAELEDRRSLGLLGQHERAIAAGGSLTVSRRATGGTEVRLSLPTVGTTP